MTNSTATRRRRKAASIRPPKPYKGYPLGPHPSGAWCKKILGKVHYFGRWGYRVNGRMERLPNDGWKDALEQYQRERDDLHAGRAPRQDSATITVADLCNHFRTAKKRKLLAGEIGQRMFDEYEATGTRLVSRFGANRLIEDIDAADFESLRAALAKQYGPVRLTNEVGKVRSVFKYGFETGLIEHPVRFGPEFKRPSASVLRKHRAKNGKRFMEAADIHKLLKAADLQLKAMLLLGVNCGFGNHDVASLPLSAVDLKKGWIDFPRPKTGVERRCPLWPQTVEALKAAIAARPEPKMDAAKPLVFLTIRGRHWMSREIANPISVATRDLMKSCKVHRDGLGFYTLRHVFETVGGGTRDQIAVDAIMGHTDNSMAGHYREHIEDERLLAVTNHVHHWLYCKGVEGGTK